MDGWMDGRIGFEKLLTFVTAYMYISPSDVCEKRRGSLAASGNFAESFYLALFLME
jgi:hypothetical protein